MAERARSKKTADPSDPSAGKPAGKPGKSARSVPKNLTGELSQLLEKTLLPDLHRRAADPQVLAALTARHHAERKAHRTADKLEDFCAHLLEQVGAAWILSCVFVRTLEDRALLRQRRLAGPGADDSEQLFRELFPSLGKRDYLRMVFRELGRLPGAKDVLGPEKNLAWLLAPSEDAARELYDFFRKTEDDGSLRFTFGGPDTRFLGDLYQDLSASVRERYALLQTPRFVEKFILDLTLEPAVQRFGLVQVRLLDPTCGSGHFLLGAFDRLFEHRQRAFPGRPNKEHAAAALAQVYGCDLNPYAVAIARFRLTLAFLEKAQVDKLHLAPEPKLNLVVADSLLYGAKGQTWDLSLLATDKELWGGELFNLEDPPAAKAIFQQGYHAVVGNPPYITCKDSELRELYRKCYRSAAGKYALAAPFTECFFQLAAPEGFVGLINANSFMKREFGKKLIEEVLPKLDLSRIIDTSGAFIPGHGTPTVLLFGQNRQPLSSKIPVVMGRRGEPTVPEDAEQGVVWQSILKHFCDADFENSYISTRLLDREVVGKHPWSLGGGGVSDLKDQLEQIAKADLSSLVQSIGFMAISGEDDVFLRPMESWKRSQGEYDLILPLIAGEHIRDWSHDSSVGAFFPYEDCRLSSPEKYPLIARDLWNYRRQLFNRPDFSGKKYIDVGRPWYGYHQVPLERLRTPLSIGFAFVATHNQFVLDRGGKVFNRTAPIIKLKSTATEQDHLALLGYLNSSMACFWMKQAFYAKASATGDISTVRMREEDNRYEFVGTGMQKMPIPEEILKPGLIRDQVLHLVLCLEQASQRRSVLEPGPVLQFWAQSRQQALHDALETAKRESDALWQQMVCAQEELDWLIYSAFGLAPEFEICSSLQAKPEQRPFLWKDDKVPSDLDGGLVSAWSQRRRFLQDNEQLRLVESAVFKRPWEGRRGVFGHQVQTYEDRARDAGTDWLLEQVEKIFKDQSAECLSMHAIARQLTRVDSARAVAEFLTGERDPDLATVLLSLYSRDSVPYLAALRYTDPGLENRAQWEATWALQRREDAGESVGDIPVPPSTTSKTSVTPSSTACAASWTFPKSASSATPAPSAKTTAARFWAGPAGITCSAPRPVRPVPGTQDRRRLEQRAAYPAAGRHPRANPLAEAVAQRPQPRVRQRAPGYLLRVLRRRRSARPGSDPGQPGSLAAGSQGARQGRAGQESGGRGRAGRIASYRLFDSDWEQDLLLGSLRGNYVARR